MSYKRLIILFFLLYCFAGRAQYIFTTLQSKDGLLGNEVHCSYKDSEGFMWFGTSLGLNRFDGSNFKVYNSDNKKFPGLANGFVTSILQIGPDTLMIGCSKGLFCHDKRTGKFVPVTFMDDKNMPLPEKSITKLMKDDHDRLWIATDKGLFVYKDQKAIPGSLIFPRVVALTNLYIIGTATFWDEHQKGIWIGTLKGFFFYERWKWCGILCG